MTAAPEADKRTMLRSLRRAVREGGALPSKSTTTCAHVSLARKLGQESTLTVRNGRSLKRTASLTEAKRILKENPDYVWMLPRQI
jgi:hypothetical protein